MLKEENFYDAVSQVWKLVIFSEELAIATDHNFDCCNLFARFCVTQLEGFNHETQKCLERKVSLA